MKYLKLFSNKEEYDLAKASAVYPCIYYLEDYTNIETDLHISEKESWMKCVYEIPQEVFDNTSSVTLFDNKDMLINAYRINDGEIIKGGNGGGASSLGIYEVKEVTLSGATLEHYFPSDDAIPLGKEITTDLVFELNRPIESTDIIFLFATMGGEYLFELAGTVEQMGEYVSMYFTFIDDTSYTYSDMIINEMFYNDFAEVNIGIFIVNPEWGTQIMVPPTLITSIQGSNNGNSEFIEKVSVDSSSVDANGLITIDYKLMNKISEITSAFNNVNYLKEIDIRNIDSATDITISENSFANNTALTKIMLGGQIKEIKDQAFQNCTSLSNIVSEATIAPKLGTNVFQGVKENGTLEYPAGANYSTWTNVLPSGWSTKIN
jgi:hypothetical protein